MIKWLLLAYLGISLSLFAKENVVQDNGYHFGNYDKSDGLLHNQINDIFQDSQGFIWIATYQGLSRFDGITFMTLDSENQQSDNIASIYSTIIT